MEGENNGFGDRKWHLSGIVGWPRCTCMLKISFCIGVICTILTKIMSFFIAHSTILSQVQVIMSIVAILALIFLVKIFRLV